MAYHGAMSRFAPLLRALLCLILLVNGTTYAHAATGMPAAESAAARQAAQHDDPPCHEDVGAAAPVPVDAALPADDSAALPDCCTAGSCDGVCTLHAPALLWPTMLQPMAPLPAETPSYRAHAHASVHLPHRHRPPILVA